MKCFMLGAIFFAVWLTILSFILLLGPVGDTSTIAPNSNELLATDIALTNEYIITQMEASMTAIAVQTLTPPPTPTPPAG
jgi:hypothetical protein